MYTYQDLTEVGTDEKKRMDFVQSAISQHKMSDRYKTAEMADEYDRHKNRTIVEYQKLLYTVSGQAVLDEWSPNHKMASKFFNRFTVQQNQYLLGNGITWTNSDTKERLGLDFDKRLQDAGRKALIGGVSFGFFNYDHLEVFSVLEFVPLYDEENGALMAGIRWWQIDSSKPMRATLYELDGYTDYIWKDGKGGMLNSKRHYIQLIRHTEADGDEIYDGENYPSFPIVPLWGNPHHQSEIVGIREQIDCYDLIKSGFANTVDEASFVYWVIQNAGGMDDVDLAKFVERIKTMHAATVEEDGATAEAKVLETPHQSRDALLDIIRRDLYDDYMALDIKELSSSNATATQIRAAYEALDDKADQYEYCIVDFIDGILAVAGIEDTPTFTRSRLVNVQEEVQTIVSAASYLDDDYVTRKIMTILGDGDQVDEVLERMAADDMERFSEGGNDYGGYNSGNEDGEDSIG